MLTTKHELFTLTFTKVEPFYFKGIFYFSVELKFDVVAFFPAKLSIFYHLIIIFLIVFIFVVFKQNPTGRPENFEKVTSCSETSRAGRGGHPTCGQETRV